MTNLRNFTVKQINADMILHRDEMPITCAYRMPVVLPHPQLANQAIIQNPLCGTNCHLFEVQDDIATMHCCKHSILLQKGTQKDGTRAAGTSDFLEIVNK
jgi:hypothetical protein